MVFQEEPLWGQRFDVAGAAFDLIDVMAAAAMEVVVMRLAAEFVSRGGLPRQADGLEHATCRHGLGIAINGRDAQAIGMGSSQFERLLRT